MSHGLLKFERRGLSRRAIAVGLRLALTRAMRWTWILILIGACADQNESCTVGTHGGDPCGLGLRCSAEAGASGVCVCSGYRNVLRENDDCVNDDCELCREGLLCGSDFTCTQPHQQAAGAACAVEDECQLGLLCNEQHCEAPRIRGEGEPCNQQANCAPGFRCNLALDPAVCRAPIEGELCRSVEDCALGHTCNRGFVPSECHPPQPAGGYCGDRADCASSVCDLSIKECR